MFTQLSMKNPDLRILIRNPGERTSIYNKL